jgi:DNA topoisomerase VI subunit B
MFAYLLRLKQQADTQIYKLRVEDNGSGIPPRLSPQHLVKSSTVVNTNSNKPEAPSVLGGKMAVLYGQITTHQPVFVTSSTGQEKIYSFKLMIDIQRNKPIILDRKVLINKD